MHADMPQDEQDVIFLAQQGDRCAMERVLSMHYPLIRSLASRISCASLNLKQEDLIQAGCLGLLRALRKYQPAQHVKLITYAVPWILGEMKSAVRFENNPACLSVNQEFDEEGGTLLDILRGSDGVRLSDIDLRIALEKLDENARLLICLRYFRGKTQKEAALLLQKSQAQICRMERRALDQLHTMLA